MVSEASQEVIVREMARCQSRLRTFVRCLLVRCSDVDDVLQDINAVLWEKADEFKQGTDFWAWASQIARFKVLNQLRSYGRERLVFDLATVERLADVAEHQLKELDARREALEECLTKLAPPQRQLIDLRYVHGHAVDRIAETVGRSAGAVRQTLYRIRAVLLECIQRRLSSQGGAP
jgi:RNA polymerase sigma-70 factor (ECF subfamily)